MKNFNIGWYVLYVKSRWEKKVYNSLREISLESFLPEIKTIKQWKDRKKMILKPLFPSYVFVKIKSSMEFYKALSVNGACAFICLGNEYARVADKEVNQIKLLISSKDVTDVLIDTQLPKVGEINRIANGPLAGLKCEVLRVGGINKIFVQIDSLKQNIIASIPSHYFINL